MQFFKLIILVLILSSLAGCAYLEELAANVSEEEQSAPLDNELFERGVAVYLSSYCGSCHQLDAAETRGIFGPEHNSIGLLAEERILDPAYTGNATTPAEYISESILDPQIYYTPGFASSNHQMYAFTHLPAEDVDAMVYMLLQQRQPANE